MHFNCLLSQLIVVSIGNSYQSECAQQHNAASGTREGLRQKEVHCVFKLRPNVKDDKETAAVSKLSKSLPLADSPPLRHGNLCVCVD